MCDVKMITWDRSLNPRIKSSGRIGSQYSYGFYRILDDKFMIRALGHNTFSEKKNQITFCF